MGKNVWVTGKKADGFRVKTEGAERSAGIYRTQQKAIEAGTGIAKNHRAELIVQDVHGRIRSKDSYGPDSPRRKDREH